MRTYNFLVLTGLLLVGCNKLPFDRTSNGSGGGPTGAFTGTNSFVIFNSELLTGGGAFEFPGSEGQSLSFSDTSNPISHRSIRYSWTGQPVSNPSGVPNPESAFAGFDLMDTATLDTYASTLGRNLQTPNYGKATFYARGSLSTNTVLKIEVSDDGNVNTAAPCIVLSANGTDPTPGPSGACSVNGSVFNPLAMPTRTLSSSWQQFTITIPNSALANIKDFFKATFVYTNPGTAPVGQGGTAYVDVIQYQP